MSNSEHEPTNQPAPGAVPEPLVYAIQAQFHPPIKLDKKKGLEFAPKLSSAIDPKEVTFEEGRWIFSQPMGDKPSGRFVIGVAESHLSIEATHPSERAEMFENRSRVILREFQKMFHPELMLGSGAMMRATLQIDGDARTFLAEHVTRFAPERLRPLKRPLHLFGIRLFLPPYVVQRPASNRPKKGKRTSRTSRETTDWMVDVKVESLLDDTSRIFLEADARWEAPKAWSDSVNTEVVDRLKVVSDFLRTNLVDFLTNQ